MACSIIDHIAPNDFITFARSASRFDAPTFTFLFAGGAPENGVEAVAMTISEHSVGFEVDEEELSAGLSPIGGGEYVL